MAAANEAGRTEAAANEAAANEAAGDGRTAYRRSAGSARGEARRRELLERVTDDLATHGLVDFTLRSAARAAGTTHKVLLYYFDGADDLLVQAVTRLRERRIERGLLAAAAADDAATGGGRTLAERVRALWPALISAEADVLDQAMGLAMYDPTRFRGLGREATRQYLPALLSICPAAWSETRKLQVAEMILAALRGFLVDWRSSADAEGIAAGFHALARALDREEAAAS